MTKVYRLVTWRLRYGAGGEFWSTTDNSKWYINKDTPKANLKRANELLKITGIDDIRFEIEDMEISDE